MLYSFFSQSSPKLGGKLHALWTLFCSPYAPWCVNIAVWWGLGLQPLCSDSVFSLSRPQLSSRNCVPWACTFQHTWLHFWVPGAFNALVTLRVPHWYAGSCRTCRAGGMLLQGHVGLAQQMLLQALLLNRCSMPVYPPLQDWCVCGSVGDEEWDPLWGCLYTASSAFEFWNITGDIFHLPLPSVRISDLSYQFSPSTFSQAQDLLL